MSVKPKTIFDHIAGISHKKDFWFALSEADQKSFSPYIINRWLSMHYDMIEIVDAFQQYTIGQLNTKHVYQLYHDILPKKQLYLKYIKGKKDEKYNKELLELLSQHFQLSIDEVSDYVEIWMTSDKAPLVEILRNYGKTTKEINQWLK